MLDYISQKFFKGNKAIAFYSVAGVSLILLILIIVLFANLFSSKSTGYDYLDEQLLNAAKNYYEDNEKLLPENGNTITLDSSTLVDGKYIKALDELYKDDTCTAQILVHAVENEYLYSVQLNCTNYKTKTLKEELLSNVVTENSGLYQVGSKYIFKGEYVNNYVEFDNKTWRIVSVDDTGIRMYLDTEKLEKFVWDDRYNLEKKADYGKNVFETSRMNENLKNFYESNKFVSSKNNKYLVAANWCIGGLTPGTELSKIDLCKKTTEKMYLGTLEATDFANASLEPTCKKFDDTQCINYNYLASINGTNWTLNPLSENTYEVYAVDMNGAEYYKASKTNTLRPVIYLNSITGLKNGMGTLSDPYIIK